MPDAPAVIKRWYFDVPGDTDRGPHNPFRRIPVRQRTVRCHQPQTLPYAPPGPTVFRSGQARDTVLRVFTSTVRAGVVTHQRWDGRDVASHGTKSFPSDARGLTSEAALNESIHQNRSRLIQLPASPILIPEAVALQAKIQTQFRTVVSTCNNPAPSRHDAEIGTQFATPGSSGHNHRSNRVYLLARCKSR